MNIRVEGREAPSVRTGGGACAARKSPRVRPDRSNRSISFRPCAALDVSYHLPAS